MLLLFHRCCAELSAICLTLMLMIQLGRQQEHRQSAEQQAGGMMGMGAEAGLSGCPGRGGVGIKY